MLTKVGLSSSMRAEMKFDGEGEKLEPFLRINPCGYEGMVVTQIADLKPEMDISLLPTPLAEQLITELKQILGYNNH